jgi:hypothetical protein
MMTWYTASGGLPIAALVVIVVYGENVWARTLGSAKSKETLKSTSMPKSYKSLVPRVILTYPIAVPANCGEPRQIAHPLDWIPKGSANAIRTGWHIHRALRRI